MDLNALIVDDEQLAIVEIEVESPRRAETRIGGELDSVGTHGVHAALDLGRNPVRTRLADVALVRPQGERHPPRRIVDFPDAEVPAVLKDRNHESRALPRATLAASAATPQTRRRRPMLPN